METANQDTKPSPEYVASLLAKLTVDERKRATDNFCTKCWEDGCTGWCDYDSPMADYGDGE